MNRDAVARLVTLSLLVIGASCAEKPSVHLSITNSSTQIIEWAWLDLDRDTVEFGVIGGGGGGGKTYMYYQKPIPQRVRLRLVDQARRTNDFDVSLGGVYTPGRSGVLNFDITSSGITPQFRPSP
jgi:hypothetical protein